MGSVCHWHIYILLYVKLLWCSCVDIDLLSIVGGDGVNLPWVYVHSVIYETFLV